MNNNDIIITQDERKYIIDIFVAYKGMVDKTIDHLNRKCKPYQKITLQKCVQCSKDVNEFIKILEER